ncbi:helix-turn-helix transcriptional regulator [Nocardioides humi]|uniref:Helix-turn-helix domain-containing protein n=1 Tax=Nocardioides humi TaxID=449461 RepID=A0ABN2B368_9ACTN|nr:helix-turn-helix domain-containing protein [Nocardioides humi]
MALPSAVGTPHSEVTGTRGRVLVAIRTAAAPVTVDDLATGLDLHPNTVRFHATALEDAGLVLHESRPTGGKGRPRAVYLPTPQGTRSGQRNYRLLADVLVEDLAATAPDPAEAAHAAGRAWGTRLAAARSRGRRTTPGAAVAVLAEMGFDPEPRPVRRPREIHLLNCPFRELVDSHQELVCALHGGMLAGLLDVPEGDDPLLRPFATPTSCLVRVP